MQRVISGTVIHPRTIRISSKRFHKGCVIKDINSCLMTDELVSRFPQLRPVIVIRHPLGVLRSRIRLIGKYKMPGELDFLDDESLNMEFPEISTLKKFVRNDDPVPGLLAAWAAQLLVVLRRMEHKSHFKAVYEEFSTNPGIEFERLVAFWGQEVDDKLFQDAVRLKANIVMSSDR